jgi:hypothetical protein
LPRHPAAKPSLGEEFDTTPDSRTRSKCYVCYTVTPDVRKFIEEKWNAGFGEYVVGGFLKRKGLWPQGKSYHPIRSHMENHTKAPRMPIRMTST